MAKITKKTPTTAVAETKLAKVNKKSVTIQKADKKPIKNLKAKAEKTPALTKPQSPQKKKQKSPGKAKNLQKKTTPTGGAAIVPKKAKKLQKAGVTSGKAVKDLVSREDVQKCVTAFRSAIKLGLAEKKAMLDPDFKYILQLCCFKIPQCPERIARTQLKHSLVDETDDVCLFVKDIEAGNKRDYQPTIDYFREKLDAAGITNVKTIMPISQITKDYKQHEMLRKLCNSHDLFLVDGRIAPHMAKKLGKTFYLQKKSPISVRLNHPQLKEHLQNAVAKVPYHQTASGDSTAIHIAKHGMEDEVIVDNIQQVLQNMKEEYPGGWKNIKRVFLRPAINLSKSSVPVYINASSGENVPVPVIEGPKAKAVAKKQKELNKLLPEGMVMTNKGELAFVAGQKRPAAEDKSDKEKPDKKKLKKDDNKQKKGKKAEKVTEVAEKVAAVAAKKDKKKAAKEPAAEKPVVVVAAAAAPKVVEEKKQKKDKKEKKPVTPVVESVPEPTPAAVVDKKQNKKKDKKAAVVEAAPAPTKAPVEKAPKNKSKKVAAAVPVVEEPTPEPEKKQKNGKKTAAAAPEVIEAPVAAEKPTKSSKKSKKAVAEVLDTSDANLSKEVSDLWEQIKNESAAELGEEAPAKAKKSSKRKTAAPVAAAEGVVKAEKKSKKQKK